MTKKILILNEWTVQRLTERLETVLKPLAKEFGVDIDLGHCAFKRKNCRFQLKVAVLDSTGNPITAEMDTFRQEAKSYGFEPTDLGRKFVEGGQSYTICGLRPQSWRYPIIVKSDDGKEYKFSCFDVLHALDKSGS